MIVIKLQSNGKRGKRAHHIGISPRQKPNLMKLSRWDGVWNSNTGMTTEHERHVKNPTRMHKFLTFGKIYSLPPLGEWKATLLFVLASFPNLAQENRIDLASHFGNEYKIYEIWQKTGDGRSNSDFRSILNGKVKVIQFQWVERPLFLGVGKIRHAYIEPRSCAYRPRWIEAGLCLDRARSDERVYR